MSKRKEKESNTDLIASVYLFLKSHGHNASASALVKDAALNVEGLSKTPLMDLNEAFKHYQTQKYQMNFTPIIYRF
jgi:hypothetical protein